MTFAISPGVYEREIDLSTVVSSAFGAAGAFAGKFTWGPVNQVVRVSSEPDLVSRFGAPVTESSVDFHVAASFLAYSNALDVVRMGKEAQSKNASSTGSAPSVLNDDDYVASELTGINYIAKYCGDLGNSLAVQTCDSSARYDSALPGTWAFPTAPRSKTVTYDNATTELLTQYFNVGDQLVVDGVAYGVVAVTTTDLTLDRIYAGVSVPATVSRRWAHANRFSAAPATARNHIVVIDSAGKFSGVAGTVLETFESVSTISTDKYPDGSSAYFPVLLDGSNYIRVGALGVSGTNLSTKVESLVLSGGLDQFSLIDADEALVAYDLFTNKEIVTSQFFIGGAITDVMSNYLIQNVMEVRKLGLAFFSPKLASVRTATNKAVAVVNDRKTLVASSYATMDSNWKYTFDRYNDTFIWVPCAGDHAGIYARNATQRDPWIAAAGTERGRIKSVVKLAWNPSEAERDQLYPNDVNPIIDLPKIGPVVYGQKTLLGVNSVMSRCNVRLLVNLIKSNVSEFAKTVVFELNDEFTQAGFKSKTDTFLRDIKGRRGLTDYLTVSDSTVNTPQVVQNNQFVGQVYLKPAYVAESIRLDFITVNGSTEFTEVVGSV